MGKLKRLLNDTDVCIDINSPYVKEELESLDKDYLEVSKVEFAKKYKNILFRPSTLEYDGELIPIQYNFCSNPFCNHFSKEQIRFENIKNKPSRYKIVGTAENKRIKCNDILNVSKGISLNCESDAYSNWSIAEEIRRLITINSVFSFKETYAFHHESCNNSYMTPFNNEKQFYKRGKSSSNSQKYQCKECKKYTNVLPDNNECYTYNQKKNSILPLLAHLLVSRTPVKRSCEILNIAPKTYYHKLEILYKKCLEFLDMHETKKLNNTSFEKLWICTDKMVYNLNNVRQKGKGGLNYEDAEELRFQTAIIASADSNSKYVFRSDVAYDYQITQEEIENDTLLYHDDHLYSFCRKNARLRFSYSPQPPTINDIQNYDEYLVELNKFNKRKEYIEGMHVNSTYTSIAHYFLIQKMVNCKKWIFISDEDTSIITSISRVFSDEISSKQLYYFICRMDKTLDKKTKFKLYSQSYGYLKSFIASSNAKEKSLYNAQISIIVQRLQRHNFYDKVMKDGDVYLKKNKNYFEHPLPTINEGRRLIGCVTDTSHMTNEHLARYIVNVNNHAIDIFFNQIRRRISILERPLVTATNEGKSYIYSNYNPKYAQYLVTILRTFHNFCWTVKSSDGELLTPAQRLGIATKQYEIKDIIYYN